VEQVGRPLELDTDGIWCILPASFPQDFKFKLKDNKGSIPLGYPCAMLNADVHDRYTNHQYQDLSGPVAARRYDTHSECSIFFELDGPYRAMVLPASPEEGKLLKKVRVRVRLRLRIRVKVSVRFSLLKSLFNSNPNPNPNHNPNSNPNSNPNKKYAVFNFDGTIAELKGFELKRRGELELVKAFQSQVFEQFLKGTSLDECYACVGDIGNKWLDVLDTQGIEMDDDELLQLISERKTISKTIDQYAG
jgi:DNA polymerase epsilon subunit 1